MKKIALVTFGIIMILCLSGCGGKRVKLECIQKKSGFDTEYNVGFKGKTVGSIDFNYKYDLAGYAAKDIETMKKQDFCEVIKNTMQDYKDAFKSCNFKFEPDYLIITADIDINKIAKDNKSKTASVEDTKNDLEKQGYSCTIKEVK